MRTGAFTSSSIYLLMTNNKAKDGFGVPAITYIKGKQRELLLGRNLQKERSSRPTSYGKLVESRVFNLLGTEYTLRSDERDIHPEIERWTGAADMVTTDKVCDIKCPFSLNVYCDKADIMIANDIEGLKKKFPENYWQLVSNSILTGKPIAELIIYCPYLEELAQILTEVKDYDGDQNEIAWINWANDDELPYLIKGNYYQNLYKMEWEVSEEDKQALYERVKKATELL
jgi:hypothetical protein